MPENRTNEGRAEMERLTHKARQRMNARLEIKYDGYDGTWLVEVWGADTTLLFYNRTAFKWTAWISFYIWKYITRNFECENDVSKNIKL